MQAGVRRFKPDGLDPVQDCRRPRRNLKFPQRLNLLPAQTGEDRIFALRHLSWRAAELVRTSTPRPTFGSGGQAFQTRRARRVQRPECLEVRFGQDDGCNPAVLLMMQRPPTGESLLWKERQKKRRS